MGYDSVYKERTHVRRNHEEGVVIAYKRKLYQLFKSVSVELNDTSDSNSGLDVNMKDKVITDDVGIVLFLQPWEMYIEKEKNENSGNSEIIVVEDRKAMKKNTGNNKDIASHNTNYNLTNTNSTNTTTINTSKNTTDTPKNTERTKNSENKHTVKNSITTAVCIVCASVSDRKGDAAVRLEQTIYLMNIIELNNSMFQVPVILGIKCVD